MNPKIASLCGLTAIRWMTGALLVAVLGASLVVATGCGGASAQTGQATQTGVKIRHNGDITELPLGVDIDKAVDVPYTGVARQVATTRGITVGASYVYEGQYLTGQCVAAMKSFYSGRLGIGIGSAGGDGGASNYGSRTIANMDKLSGSSPAKPFDMVVFDRHQGTKGLYSSGHVGTVASTDASGRSVVLVDSNWVATNTGGVHVVNLNAYRILCIFRPKGVFNGWPPFPRQSTDADVKYRGHFQTIGDFSEVSNGEILGTTGHGLRQEAVRITSTGRNVTYQVHVSNIGWMAPVSNGALAGTTGQGLQMEAIKIWVDRGTIDYYVHVQNIGWMGPYHNGEQAGTTGQNLRIEAMAIHVHN